MKHPRKGSSWMASHIRDSHHSVYNEADPTDDWIVSISGQYRKPLDRQVAEFLGIRKAKNLGRGLIKGKERKVSKNVFNTKDEWFSHVSEHIILLLI